MAGASLALLVGVSLGLAGVAGAAAPEEPGGGEKAKPGGGRPSAGPAVTPTTTPKPDKRDRGKPDAKPDAGPDAKPDRGSGNNGTVKIHAVRTAADDRRNQPHVCAFYLDAFGFDAGQVTWRIQQQAQTGRSLVRVGTVTVSGDGAGRSDLLGLVAGHYKLTWTTGAGQGQAKHKVFWVSCGSRDQAGGKDRNRCEPQRADKPARDDRCDKRQDGEPGDRSDASPTPTPDDTAGSAGRPGGGQGSAEAEDTAVAGGQAAVGSGREAGDALALTGSGVALGLVGAALMLLGIGGLFVLTGRLGLRGVRR
jgi:hypothetical protein